MSVLSTLPAGTFNIDPSHSRVGFSARHAMVTKVRGSFNEYAGSGTVDNGIASLSIEITVSSIDTRSAGTYNGYERDGTTVALGGYSNKYVIDEDYAVLVPGNLGLSGVAPLLCAGITLYSPLRHWKAGVGSKVGVIGLGGLGHMGVKFAVAMGAEVTVFSHSPNKESDAKRMGAKHFIVTKDPQAFEGLNESFDLILNTVSADLDINLYLGLLKLDGALVVIGLPGKPYEVSGFNLLRLRRSLAGSMIGGLPELQEMLHFCSEKNILSDVEVINANYINEAYERTVASDVKYRFVIDASTF